MCNVPFFASILKDSKPFTEGITPKLMSSAFSPIALVITFFAGVIISDSCASLSCAKEG